MLLIFIFQTNSISKNDALVQKTHCYVRRLDFVTQYQFVALDLNILVRQDLVRNCQYFALSIFDPANTVPYPFLTRKHFIISFFENYAHGFS